MAFTDLATIRKHLLSSETEKHSVTDILIYLIGQSEYILPESNLIESRETVKWRTSNSPTSDGPLELIDERDVSLANSHLIPGTVVVALNASLTTIYVEEVDYQIDYENGLLRRLSSGSIPNHQLVYAYYEKWAIFTRGVDYSMDDGRGYIRRTQNSSIPDRAHVFIDYTVDEGSLEDAAIIQAIVEANDIVVRGLSSNHTAASTDQGLKSGTTQLALSIIARSIAAQCLTANRASDAYNRAKEWQALSTLWEKKAWQTLGPFLDPNQLHSPVAQ
jgi:hypothetical protein